MRAQVTSFTRAESFVVTGNNGGQIKATVVAAFTDAWAMTFLPRDELLVTTKSGKLWLVTKGKKREVLGVPKALIGGQGGLGDIILHPNFVNNRFVYLSYVEGDSSASGAVVVRATLKAGSKPRLTNIKRIWTQMPKVKGKGHFSYRMAFGPMGKLYITSGDRKKIDPAQDMAGSLGKIIRLKDDGTVPKDNPYQNHGDLAKSFWSVGHRNMLGITFDEGGRLWATEMGPRHGDELNLIKAGGNYGWPLVSEGNHYDGTIIPNHITRPEFMEPKVAWVPSIAPSGLVIYNGKHFPEWKGDAFIGGLVSRALIRVKISSESTSKEEERFEWGERIREVEQAPDGSLWVVEDGQGRLLRLTRT